MRLSICIPVYNRRQLVGDAIRSALAQDVDGVEILAVDNCSDDGTWEYLQTLSDPRVKVYRNEKNLGLYGNFNRCGELATGRYVLFLCSDDQIAPGFVSSALPLIEACPQVALLSSRGRIVTPSGRALGVTGDYFPAGRYRGNSVAAACLWTMLWHGANPFNYPSGAIFRADALRRELPFREEFGTPADIDLYLRTLQHGDLLVVKDMGCLITGHAGQSSSGAKANGDFIGEMLFLLESRRLFLEKLGVYQRFREQISASVFAHMSRSKRRNKNPEAPSFGVWITLRALLSRLNTRVCALFGFRRLPYLMRSD